MAEESTSAVHPLGVSPSVPPTGSPFAPVVARAFVLLGIGLLVGWLVGSSVGRDDRPSPQETTPTTSTSPPAVVRWQGPGAPPTTGDGFAPRSVSAAVELGDTMYLNVVYVDMAGQRPSRSVLWESSDGATWREIVPRLGDGARITDIDVYERGLLLSGIAGGRVLLWRSIADRTIGPGGWTKIDLGPAPAPFFGLGNVTTAVDANNEIVTTAILPFNATIEVLDPLLPPGVSLADSRYGFDPLRGVRNLETGEIVFRLGAAPEAVARDNELWVRLIDPDGRERLSIIPLDPGARAVQTADLRFIETETIWQSDDGARFDPVSPGLRADRPLVFPPAPFRSGFVGATLDENGRLELWNSASGSHWSPLGWVPPEGCTGFSGLAIGGEHIVIPGGDAGRVCEVANGKWTVGEMPVSTSGAGAFIAGGTGGLVMVTRSDSRSSLEIAVSTDGTKWRATATPTGDHFGGVFMLGDRIVLLANRDPARRDGLEAYVGRVAE